MWHFFNQKKPSDYFPHYAEFLTILFLMHGEQKAFGVAPKRTVAQAARCLSNPIRTEHQSKCPGLSGLCLSFGADLEFVGIQSPPENGSGS